MRWERTERNIGNEWQQASEQVSNQPTNRPTNIGLAKTYILYYIYLYVACMNVVSAFTTRDEEIQCVIKCRNEIEDWVLIHTHTYIVKETRACKRECVRERNSGSIKGNEWEKDSRKNEWARTYGFEKQTEESKKESKKTTAQIYIYIWSGWRKIIVLFYM